MAQTGILVFGKTGQVAQELAKQAQVHALGRDEADLSDPAACAKIIATHRPGAVINAAAYTAVDRAEEEEQVAQVINAQAPGAMAQACAAQGIPFLHISTDYVFDGSGHTPWTVKDPVSPLNAYGRSKLSGEQAIHAAGGNYAVLRTSWVFSAHGANFVKTMLRLGQTRDHLSVVADQIGGPTPAAGIAGTLLNMCEQMMAGHPGGTFHYAGEPAVSWADFAREIFAQAGYAVQVEDIPSSAYPTPARRPENSRLDGGALKRAFGIDQADWRAGLADVLQELSARP